MKILTEKDIRETLNNCDKLLEIEKVTVFTEITQELINKEKYK